MPAANETINIAEVFSAYPAGRDDNDGPFNGSKFRDHVLAPRLRSAIERSQKLIVSLDGVRSFGSSFLEEAFGGLVRVGFSKADIRKHLTVESTMVGGTRYIEAITRYIDRARG